MRTGKDWVRYIFGNAGAGIDGCCAPDSASEFCGWWWDTRAGIDGCCALNTASGIGVLCKLLGPVLMDAVLPIPPVIIGLREIYWGRYW